VVVEEGQPLKFTATFETVPPIEPGDYSTITIQQKKGAVAESAVDEALENLASAPLATSPSSAAASRRGTRSSSI
jgi:FKBP-type peptidyl-prolyl cis-trans isomerase (trigger factor)